jgi:ectoine utilization protein EutC
MRPIRILTEAELRQAIELDQGLLVAIRDAFAGLATGAVIQPPILHMALPEVNGEVDVKTAYVPGLEGFAIKISPGFFDNPKLGLPSLSGMMALLSTTTGLVLAVLLDNGYLTDLRTAAAGAVAAHLLARRDATVAGILGAGLQARLQLEALKLVRPLERALVWARDPEKAAGYAQEMAERLGIPVEAVPSAEAVVRGSSILVTTTPARAPLVEAQWLHPGLHITAMGSDSPEKNELAPAVLTRADRFVCDRESQSATVGELRAARAAGLAVEVTELGLICLGRASGRERAEEITVCDLTGTGVQDTAIATLALRRAGQLGLGTVIRV